jgi:DNA-binding GntR family transcriptional regulator
LATGRAASDGADALAYGRLLVAIRGGQLAAGAHVSADAMARRFGVGRQSVRAAIQRLAAEGLVDLRPNRGAFVLDRSAAEVTELFELRALCEGLVAREAAQRIDAAGLARAEAVLRTLAAARADVDRFVTAHTGFHAVFHDHCPKPRLKAECQRWQIATEPLLRLMLRHSPTAHADTVQEHRRLLAAVATGDPDHAERAMRAHVLEQDATALLPAPAVAETPGAARADR